MTSYFERLIFSSALSSPASISTTTAPTSAAGTLSDERRKTGGTFPPDSAVSMAEDVLDFVRSEIDWRAQGGEYSNEGIPGGKVREEGGDGGAPGGEKKNLHDAYLRFSDSPAQRDRQYRNRRSRLVTQLQSAARYLSLRQVGGGGREGGGGKGGGGRRTGPPAEGEAADARFVAWSAGAAIPKLANGSWAAFEAAARIVSPVGSIAAVKRILRRDQPRWEEDEDVTNEGAVITGLLFLLRMNAGERIDAAIEGTNG